MSRSNRSKSENTPTNIPENQEFNAIPNVPIHETNEHIEAPVTLAPNGKPLAKKKWYFCILGFSIPPLSYTIDPKTVDDEELIKELKELGVTKPIIIKYSPKLTKFRNAMDTYRSKIYGNLGCQKIGNLQVFSATSDLAAYRQVDKWSDDFNTKFGKLLKAVDDNGVSGWEHMKNDFQDNLISALDTYITEYRPSIDDALEEAQRISNVFVEEKFPSANDMMAGCGVNVPIIREYNHDGEFEIPKTMAGVKRLIDAKQAEDPELRATLNQKIKIDNLLIHTPRVMEGYYKAEAYGSVVFLEDLQNSHNATPGTSALPGMYDPLLMCVSDLIGGVTRPDTDTTSDDHDIEITGSREILVELQTSIDALIDKERYITAYEKVKLTGERLRDDLKSLQDDWEIVRGEHDAATDTWKNIEDNPDAYRYQTLIPIMVSNLETLIAMAQKVIDLREREKEDKAKNKKKVGGQPKNEELPENLWDSGDDSEPETVDETPDEVVNKTSDTKPAAKKSTAKKSTTKKSGKTSLKAGSTKKKTTLKPKAKVKKKTTLKPSTKKKTEINPQNKSENESD